MIVASPGPLNGIAYMDADRAGVVIGPALSDSNTGGRSGSRVQCCRGQHDHDSESR